MQYYNLFIFLLDSLRGGISASGILLQLVEYYCIDPVHTSY